MESLGFKLPTPKQSQTFAEPDLWKRPGKTAENKTEICLPHSSLSAMMGKRAFPQKNSQEICYCSMLKHTSFPRNPQPQKNTCCPLMHLDSLGREGRGWSHFSTGGQFTCKNDLQAMITFWVFERHFLQNSWSWPADLGETGSICH